MKQTYDKPETNIVFIEPASMLALSDGSSVNVNNGEYADQMAGERNSERSWGNLWND